MRQLGRSFWRLLAGSGASNLADGVALITLPLLAASITRDPVQISALAALAYVPWLVFAVPGGALVDRLDRRRAMAGANAVRGAGYGGLAVLVAADVATMPVLYATALLMGCAEVIYDSASRAILPQVLGKSALDRGNAYLSVVETVGDKFAGAPLGALLFATVAWWPVLGASAAYVVAAGIVLTLSGSYRPERADDTRLRADIVEGLSFLVHHSFLRGLTLSAGWFGLLHAMVNGVLVLYALETLGLSASEYGLLAIAAAAGSVCGGLLAPRLSAATGRGHALVGATVVSPVCLVGMGLVTSPWLAGTLFAGSAGAVTVWNVLSMSVRQAMIPERLFGRVLGAYRMVIWGVIPLGALAGGVLAAWTSLGTVFVVAGIGQLSAAFWIAALMRSHRSEIDDAYRESTTLQHR